MSLRKVDEKARLALEIKNNMCIYYKVMPVFTCLWKDFNYYSLCKTLKRIIEVGFGLCANF